RARHAGGRRTALRGVRLASEAGADQGPERPVRPRHTGDVMTSEPITAQTGGIAAGTVAVAAAGGAEPEDLWDVRRVAGLGGVLAAFNRAGVLAPADVHVATTLGELCGEHAPAVLLAA